MLKNSINILISLLKRTPPLALAAFAALVVLVSTFQELVDDILEGDTLSIDTQILNMMRTQGDLSDPIGPLWFQEMMRDFTALGGIGILAFLTAVAAVYLFITGKNFRGFYLICAVGTGTLLSNLLKAGFDRPRPDIGAYDSHVYTASLPSGHSLMAALVYLTLGALLAESHPSLRVRLYILSLCTLVVVMVGVSRVYLGVHWPSDVLAGWIAGAAWAMLFWLGERYLLSRQALKA